MFSNSKVPLIAKTVTHLDLGHHGALDEVGGDGEHHGIAVVGEELWPVVVHVQNVELQSQLVLG